MALFLSAQVLAGILDNPRVRKEFPTFTSLWRDLKRPKPCKCKRGKQRERILQQTKQAIQSMPNDRRNRLKEILGVREFEVVQLSRGLVKKQTL